MPLFAFDQLASVTIGQPKEFDVLPKNRDAQSIEVTIRQAQHGRSRSIRRPNGCSARPAPDTSAMTTSCTHCVTNPGKWLAPRVTIFVVAADEGLDAIDYLFQMLG